MNSTDLLLRVVLVRPAAPGRFNTPPHGLQVLAAALRREGITSILDLDPNKGDNPYRVDYSGDRILVGITVTFMTLSEGGVFCGPAREAFESPGNDRVGGTPRNPDAG